MAGGPVQSVVSLVSSLREKYNFKIITSDSDLNSTEPYKSIRSNTWVKSDLGCEVYYASLKTLNSEKIRGLLSSLDFDLVYINSFFSAKFSILPLRILKRHFQSKVIVLAPRGMLGKGALAIKAYKKKVFILSAKIFGLYDNVFWHATSEEEKEEIKMVMSPKSEIICISNLPKLLGVLKKRQKERGVLKVCFLSRISIKKNLLFALKVLTKIDRSQIHFSIYGLIEDEAYWHECKREINLMSAHVEVKYKGVLKPSEVSTALEAEHLMLLPTFNENFGHSIVESLWCGCPVLISDQTPWKDLEKESCGFAFPLVEEEKFLSALLQYIDYDQEKFDQASLMAHNYIQKKLDLESIKQQYIKLFDECIKNGPLAV